MLIGGKPVGGGSGKTIDVVNSSNEEVVGKIWQANPEEIDAAAKSSRRVFNEWRLTPAAERAAIIFKVVHAVRENVEDIGRQLTLEQGKPFPEMSYESRGQRLCVHK